MVICPKHRVLLGVKYCPSRKCQHPLHGRRKGKVSRGVNLKMSKEIKETWDVLVPVGSGVCRQCRGDHLRTVGSTDADSEVQDPGLASTSHPEPQIHEPSCSAESAEEIVEPPQLLPPATEESEQLSAAPVLHVRFQEDLISEHSDRDSDPSDRHSEALSRTSSGSQESLGAAETLAEWQPTPQIQHRLYYLNNFLRMATEGRVSPVCGASLKKSLASLDSPQTDGVQAIATLEDITHQLKQAGLDRTMADNILMRLKAGRQYLKTDFKIHTASESPCADHCRVFALSRTEKEYNGQCQHQHTITCDRCEDLKNAVSDLQLASTLSLFSPDKREELKHDLSCAAPSIEDWKSHVLRSVHQDAAKSLKPSQLLLIMDWAMKFIPTSFREKQRDSFGKKGKSWHLSVAITKAEDGTIETLTYIHLFDECNQNWFSVASIIEDSLTTMKRQKSRLNEAFLRSCNAGCHHCAFLLLSLPSLGQRVGVRIARYDFSEAQAGKDVCDRRAAALKSHIRRYINEGNDVKTASDMKAAIDSHGGVKGRYSVVCKVDERSQNNVGPGKVFSASSLARLGNPQGPTNLQVLQAFNSPDILTGVFRASSSTQEQQPAAPPTDPIAVERIQLEEEERVAFGCPEEGCIQVYQSHSSLQRHVDARKHLLALERESTYDVIKKKWAETCKSISGGYVGTAQPPTSASASVSHSQ
ncbi:unnamed protein product [Porites lobata]|uniref:C2H2-type domain-containing protein n=1 Tax=Porites lobata TaxID=104759 RepID=A0ABN8SEY6_9CNID|nr:unnamed protein product [Porites lobata]